MGTHIKSPPCPSDDATSALDSIRRIVRALRVGSRAAEKQVGLSGAQLFVLQALSANAGQSLNELAQRTRTHQSSVSVVVQRLVDRGLIHRDRSSGDSRRLELAVTASGRKLLGNAPDVAQVRLIAALDSLVAKDRSKLATLLSQLVAKMGDGDQSPHMFFEEDHAPTKARPLKKASNRTVKSNVRT